MEDKIRKELDDVIDAKLRDISTKTELDDNEVENLTKLYKLRIEEAKIESDKKDKINENNLRSKQIQSESIGRWINLGAQVGIALASLVAYDIWFNRGLRFEENGTIGSPMNRNLLSRLLPSKK